MSRYWAYLLIIAVVPVATLVLSVLFGLVTGRVSPYKEQGGTGAGFILSPAKSFRQAASTSLLTTLGAFLSCVLILRVFGEEVTWRELLLVGLVAISFDALSFIYRTRNRRVALSRIPVGETLQWDERLGPQLTDAEIHALVTRRMYWKMAGVVLGLLIALPLVL